MTRRERIKITNRETIIVLALYILFFAWWYVTAYGFGSDPSAYRYVFGFPEWFFYSCIVGYVGVTLLLWIIVKFFFKEIPFDDDDKEGKKDD